MSFNHFSNRIRVDRLSATVSLTTGHWTDEPGEANGADVPTTASDNVFSDADVAQVAIVAEKSLTAGHIDTPRKSRV
ncbi:hypothetical protein [Mycobacterium sp. DL440]|uniref:hypothetical protein n=1 Tax=Mycobacterium sp. DL440 TaxID=2675523 RepID=UPI00141D8255|nr:hypothetical protein [Mycobacterium sp. DL440]